MTKIFFVLLAFFSTTTAFARTDITYIGSGNVYSYEEGGGVNGDISHAKVTFYPGTEYVSNIKFMVMDREPGYFYAQYINKELKVTLPIQINHKIPFGYEKITVTKRCMNYETFEDDHDSEDHHIQKVRFISKNSSCY